MLKGVLKRFFREVNLQGWLLIIVGSLTWAATMVKSGLIYSFGMGFWGPNGHDGVWHIALAESLSRGLWQIPVFAGETIRNYHIGFDLFLAILHKITLIPVSTLYFQIIPPLFAFGIGLSVYLFVYRWRKSRLVSWWATFFVYFGGSWGWVIDYLRNGHLGGESLFWSQQSISTLVNPPFALSLLVIFIGLWILEKGLRSDSEKPLALASFIFGILVQVKVYAGILILAGLFISGFWRLINRQGIALIKVATGALVVSILIFSPVSYGVEKSLVFKPFWFLEEMMSTPDRFYWPKFAEAMINYKLGGIFFKGIIAYFVAFAIFWFGNLGSRFIKEPQFIYHLKNIKKLDYLEIFFYTIIGLGVIIPTFFIQNGTPWNTIQFMYYSLMFAGVLAGTAVSEWLSKQKSVKAWFIPALVIVLLTIPTTVGTLWYHYLPGRPPAKISKEEIEALSFLAKQADGVVLTLPFDRDFANAAVDNPPRPLYLYESTAYVSAFSGKQTYLEDEVNLEITGYDWKERRSKAENFFLGLEGSQFLEANSIRYIYLLKDVSTKLRFSSESEKIFENSLVTIYKV